MSPDLLNHRKWLQDVRDAASQAAVNSPCQDWRRAYDALAEAADRLDAMQARSTVREVPPDPSCGCDATGACRPGL